MNVPRFSRILTARLVRLVGVVVAVAGITAVAEPFAAAGSTAAPAEEAPNPGDLTERVLLRYQRCFDGCEAGPGSDYTTCSLTCANASLAKLDNVGRELRTCMQPCAEQLGKCMVSCYHGNDSATNVESCQLQCQGAARTCLDACQAG